MFMSKFVRRAIRACSALAALFILAVSAGPAMGQTDRATLNGTATDTSGGIMRRDSPV